MSTAFSSGSDTLIKLLSPLPSRERVLPDFCCSMAGIPSPAGQTSNCATWHNSKVAFVGAQLKGEKASPSGVARRLPLRGFSERDSATGYERIVISKYCVKPLSSWRDSQKIARQERQGAKYAK